MTRRYEILSVGGGFRHVLRSAIKRYKTLLKMRKKTKKRKQNMKKRAKKTVKKSERYETGKGGQSICYKALHRVGLGLKSAVFSVT